MNAEKKNSLTRRLQIILLVLASILFIYGFPSAKAAGEARAARNAAEDVELTVTDKSIKSVWSSSMRFEFACTIKNNSDVTLDGISGAFKIMDRDGKVLSSGTASFSGEFEPDGEYDFKLNWETDITEKTMKIYDYDFEDLRFSYEIEEVTYNGYHTVEVDK